MVFVCSMSDLFHEEVPFEFIELVWATMACCSEPPYGPHTFQVLTKRPERMLQFLTDYRGQYHGRPMCQLPNVWLGVSVENQRMADRRIPVLVRTPAVVHFVSCEPLLGPLNLRPWLSELQWVIVGGESCGPPHRMMKLDWARDIRDQCLELGVPFFLKQLGGNRRIDGSWGGNLLDGRRWQEWPALRAG